MILSVTFEETEHHIDADFGELIEIINTEIPVYDGPHQVTPSSSMDVTLKTAQTFVSGDIKVFRIPYSEVSNNAGGTTATIGGN